MNEPLEIPDRGFTVTVTGRKMYADYEIRDMAIRMHVSACAINELCSAYDAIKAKIYCTYVATSLATAIW